MRDETRMSDEARKLIFGLCLIGCIFRLSYTFYTGHDLRFPDEHRFWIQAMSIISGDGLQFHGLYTNDMPVTGFFYATVQFIFGESVLVAKIITVFVSSATIYCIAVLAYTVSSSNRSAVIAATISAIYPFFVFYSSLILSETIFVFAFVIFVISVSTAKKPNPIQVGLVGALAHLIKPTMLFLFPVVIGWKMVRDSMRLSDCWIAMLLFMLVISLWGVRNLEIIGEFKLTTTGSGQVLWEGNNPWNESGGVSGSFVDPDRYLRDMPQDLGELAADQWKTSQAYLFIVENPGLFLERSGKKFLRFWNVWPNSKDYQGWLYRFSSLLSFGVVLAGGIIGTIRLRRRYRQIELFFLIACYFSLVHMITIGSIRYRLPLEPLLIVISSVLIGQWKRCEFKSK